MEKIKFDTSEYVGKANDVVRKMFAEGKAKSFKIYLNQKYNEFVFSQTPIRKEEMKLIGEVKRSKTNPKTKIYGEKLIAEDAKKVNEIFWNYRTNNWRTKTTMLTTYKIAGKPKITEKLLAYSFVKKVQNPNYHCAAPMQLYDINVYKYWALNL